MARPGKVTGSVHATKVLPSSAHSNVAPVSGDEKSNVASAVLTVPVGPETMLVSGAIGPKGDAYSIGRLPDAAEAEEYHAEQIRTFRKAGADMVTAMTVSSVEEAIGLARVLPLGALTAGLRGERLAELAELASAGCVGFSQGDRSLGDHAVMLRAMQYAATFGLSVWLRPQDGALARLGVAHEGMISTRLGLPGIPALAETLAVSALLRWVRRYHRWERG